MLCVVAAGAEWAGKEGVILKILFTWWKDIVRSGNVSSYIFGDYLIASLLTFFGQELVFFAGQE